MFESSNTKKDSVVVFLKGGRIPSWYDLSPEEQDLYSIEHINLMKSIINKHKMIKLEGYKLLSPINDWKYFWAIEFPTFEGAESWINAEMEPPYGRYGSFNYYLARRIEHMGIDSAIKEAELPSDINENDLDHTNLVEDTGSVVVITFEMSLPGSDLVTVDKNQQHKYIKNINSVSQRHELIRLEAYRLITPQTNWHTTIITEFPTIDGAKAWIDLQENPSYIRFKTRTNYLSHKWAPRYFESWIK
tara:strand:- start:13493 stop:14230 length:738 start_codon:yes stop_codon:yes gene_type:complete